MKILVISPDYPDQCRSVYTFVKELVDQFSRMGHQCCVIAPYSITKNKRFAYFRETYSPERGEVVQILRPNYISLSNLEIMGFCPSLFFRKLALKHALENLPFTPDVIYAHFWRSGREIYSYAKKYHLPLFVANGESVIPSSDISPQYKKFYNYVMGVICASTKNMDESINHRITVREKCLLVPNAINPQIFHKEDKIVCRNALGFPKDVFIVAFCGTMCHRKGVKKLSDAISNIKGRIVCSLFIGKKENEEPTCDNILYKGTIRHIDLPRYLNAADIFVLPTLQEGCCNAIVEAMACGLPIVSSDLPFNKDILNKNNSILINPESEDDIAAAIVRLRDDLELRRRLSDGAFRTAQVLTIEKRAGKIIDFMLRRLVLSFILLFACVNLMCGRNKALSPISYGLNDCVSDIQRFYVLQDLHNDAVRLNYDIDYSGIDSISIEIPRDAKSLPLGDYTDFGGIILNVKNKTKRFQLFKMVDEVEPLDISWEQIQKGMLPNHSNDYLLIIEDQEPWVKQRIGYKYGHTRKDIMLVKNGIAQNQVVSSYGTKASRPKFSVCFLRNVNKTVKNLILNRDTASTFLTEVFKIENQNDVEIKNVIIHTPPSNMYGDAAMRINNCTNVWFKDVVIDGTYSQSRNYGYGISLNNVWNVFISGLTADGNWGVFGNNNVNTVTMENSNINRFDVHCYGKDFRFKNCIFRNLYNQFSSVYGTVSFENCSFYDFVPVLLESSYNAYTGFNLIFENCRWKPRKGRNYLIDVGNPYNRENDRQELKEKCWPNLIVNQLTVIAPKEMEEFFLFGFRKKYVEYPVKIGYISQIDVKHVNILTHDSLKKSKLKLVNRPIGFKNAIVGISDIIK